MNILFKTISRHVFSWLKAVYILMNMMVSMVASSGSSESQRDDTTKADKLFPLGKDVGKIS